MRTKLLVRSKTIHSNIPYLKFNSIFISFDRGRSKLNSDGNCIIVTEDDRHLIYPYNLRYNDLYIRESTPFGNRILQYENSTVMIIPKLSDF